MERIFEIEGQTYLRIGGMLVPFNDYDENGNPVIKPEITHIEHEDGRKDVIVNVPCLRIQVKKT